MENKNEFQYTIYLGSIREETMTPPPHDHDEPGPPHEPHEGPPHEGPPHDDHPPEPPHEGPPHDDGPPEPPHEAESTEPDSHLFVVDYEDDAERKRAEYLFNTWENGEITNPDGLVRIAEDVDANSLHRELLVKFRSSQIEAYGLTERDDPETPEARTIERSIDAPADAIESFLQYLISKKKGTERGDREYEVYTNKGRADVSYEVTPSENGEDSEDSTESEDAEDTDGSEDSQKSEESDTEVSVRISGHPPVLDYLTDYVETELGEFAASR